MAYSVACQTRRRYDFLEDDGYLDGHATDDPQCAPFSIPTDPFYDPHTYGAYGVAFNAHSEMHSEMLLMRTVRCV
eukprot:1617372-Karenia_brevis.AAC.1